MHFFKRRKFKFQIYDDYQTPSFLSLFLFLPGNGNLHKSTRLESKQRVTSNVTNLLKVELCWGLKKKKVLCNVMLEKRTKALRRSSRVFALACSILDQMLKSVWKGYELIFFWYFQFKAKLNTRVVLFLLLLYLKILSLLFQQKTNACRVNELDKKIGSRLK